jgi:hypothetical protein
MSALRPDGLARRRLAGLIFGNAPAMVDWVGWALCHRPADFPDCAGRGPDLLAQQQRADDWRALHRLFADLADIAQEGYLYDQDEAIRSACEILDRVTRGAAGPDLTPGLDHRRRVQIMLPALLILHDLREEQLAAKRNKRPAPAKAAPAKTGRRGQALRDEVIALFKEVIAEIKKRRG